jgi:Ca2+-binding RTX toxin-like protein
MKRWKKHWSMPQEMTKYLNARPTLERLEDRTLLSAPNFAELVGNALWVYDDAQSNVFNLDSNPVTHQIRVTRGSDELDFDPNTVQSITIDLSGLPKPPGAQSTFVPAEGGNDQVYLWDTLPSKDPVTVYAGNGTDTISANPAANHFYAGNLTVAVGTGPEVVTGGSGMNTVLASGDVDYTLSDSRLAGKATDTLTNIQNANITVTGGPHTIDASAFSGSATLTGGTSATTFIAGTGKETITGGGGADTLVASGDSDFTLTNSSLTLVGHAKDTITHIQNAHLTITGGAHTIDASGFSGSLTLTGGSGNDKLKGGTGPGTFDGGPGNDEIDLINPSQKVGGAIDTVKPIQGDDTVHIITIGSDGSVTTDYSLSNSYPFSTNHAVHTSFLDTWITNGGEGSFFGVPTDSAEPGTGGVVSQRFDGGLIYDSPRTGVLVVPYALPAGAISLFSDNPTAYEAQRVDFLKYFFYNGFIAERIALDGNQDDIKFADQTYRMGEALVAYSQEATILQSSGFDPTPSNNIVAIILNAFDQLQNEAVSSLPGLGMSPTPGFFLRDYVANTKTGQELRQGIPATLDIPLAPQDGASVTRAVGMINSDYGDVLSGAAPSMDVMSEDQLAQIMNGLWSVTRYCTDAGIIGKARQEANNIINYLMSVHYQIIINGAPASTGNGTDMTVAAGYLSEMADVVTGNDYFSRLDNSVKLGTIDPNSIANFLTNALEIVLAGATEGFSEVAIQAYQSLVGSDPVRNVVNKAIAALNLHINDPVYLPVEFLHVLLLASEEANGPFAETLLTGTVSLAEFLPPDIQAAFSSIGLTVPTGFTPGSVYQPTMRVGNAVTGFYNVPDGLPVIIPPHLTTKTITLESLLSGIAVTPFPGGVPNPKSGKPIVQTYAKHLVLLEMAYDPTVITDGLFSPLASANIGVLGNTPDVWAALLRHDVLGTSASDVMATAVSIAQSAPPNSPSTNNVSPTDPYLLWATKDRWETGSQWETNENNFTGGDFRTSRPLNSFNGNDFLLTIAR